MIVFCFLFRFSFFSFFNEHYLGSMTVSDNGAWKQGWEFETVHYQTWSLQKNVKKGSDKLTSFSPGYKGSQATSLFSFNKNTVDK